jgi:hypothetical protein
MPKSSTLSSPLAGQEDVVGLDVAVDHAARVGPGEHVAQGVAEGQDLARREPPAAAVAGLEGLADQQLHHEEGAAVVRDVVVDHPHRARMLEGVGDVGLAHEPLAVRRVAAELGAQHLERDAVAVAVDRQVHRRHPARADHPDDLVAVAEHAADAVLGRVSPRRSDADHRGRVLHEHGGPDVWWSGRRSGRGRARLEARRREAGRGAVFFEGSRFFDGRGGRRPSPGHDHPHSPLRVFSAGRTPRAVAAGGLRRGRG